MRKMTLLSIIAILGVFALVGCNLTGSGNPPLTNFGSVGGAGGAGKGPAAVNLKSAAGINGGAFAILAESGVSNVPTSNVTGDIGLSPAATTYLTGFSTFTQDAGKAFYTSSEVTGKLYAADMLGSTPTQMTTVINDMYTAYVDAAGRAIPDYTELYAGDLSGRTLPPGLYKWSSGILITKDVTLAGGANDTWIFQIAQNLTVGPGAKVVLSGGAQAKNIWWQVGGGVGVYLNTTSHFEGTVLAAKAIVVSTGASVNGRLLAQSAVTLAANTIVAK
jgi:hypothetical protein